MTAGRPNKMATFIEAFKEVVKQNPLDVVILTDDELRHACNELLNDENKISTATFENRKAGTQKDNPQYAEFLGLYKTALSNQKRELFQKLSTADSQWQRYAWIIERKFSEWNLKQISENNNKNTNLNLNKDVTELSDQELLDLINSADS